MKSVHSYLSDATDAIKGGRIEHAVWCIENAYSICSENERALVDLTSELILEDEFRSALDKFRLTVAKIGVMLDYHASLSKEEWVVLLTELSTAYAFESINKRRNWNHKIPEISYLMESLRLATDNFTNPDIRSRIQGMRRYNPNPLPPPL